MKENGFENQGFLTKDDSSFKYLFYDIKHDADILYRKYCFVGKQCFFSEKNINNSCYA